MQTKLSVALISAIWFSTGLAFAQSGTVHKTYSKQMRLHDSCYAQVNLELNGRNWDDTITINISVLFRGKCIYSYQSGNQFYARDEFPKEFLETYGCRNYLQCKKKFFTTLVSHLIHERDPNRDTTDEFSLLRPVLNSQFQKKFSGASLSRVDSLVRQFSNHLVYGKFDELWIPQGPFLLESVLVYSVELEDFVNIDTE